jgi:hypothetical protein
MKYEKLIFRRLLANEYKRWRKNVDLIKEIPIFTKYKLPELEYHISAFMNTIEEEKKEIKKRIEEKDDLIFDINFFNNNTFNNFCRYDIPSKLWRFINNNERREYDIRRKEGRIYRYKYFDNIRKFSVIVSLELKVCFVFKEIRYDDDDSHIYFDDDDSYIIYEKDDKQIKENDVSVAFVDRRICIDIYGFLKQCKENHTQGYYLDDNNKVEANYDRFYCFKWFNNRSNLDKFIEDLKEIDVKIEKVNYV